MKVSYKPEDSADGDPREWSFNPARVRSAVCIVIEKQWGKGDYDDWRDAVLKGDTAARRVLLWHLLKQDNPALRFGDTPDFFYDELLVEADVVELRALRAQVETTVLTTGRTEADREAVLAEIDAEIAQKTAETGEDADPKATSNESS